MDTYDFNALTDDDIEYINENAKEAEAEFIGMADVDGEEFAHYKNVQI